MRNLWMALALAVLIVAGLSGCASTPGGGGPSLFSSHSFPDSRPATGRNVFIFNPRETTWAAYDASGDLVRTGRASGGAGYCADVKRACRTPVGHFSVYAKRGYDCYSTKYPLGGGGAHMPYCMFFRGGYAIHGSSDVPSGANVSHGCIRVTPSAAAWLNQDFLNYGSSVIVRSY